MTLLAQIISETKYSHRRIVINIQFFSGMTLHDSVELGPRNVGEKAKRSIQGIKGPLFAFMSCSVLAWKQRVILLKYKGVSTFSIQIEIIQGSHTTDICSILFKNVKESVKGSLISLVSLESNGTLRKHVLGSCSRLKPCFRKWSINRLLVEHHMCLSLGH